ncbi:Anti-sigma regulatory factor (Ser/Thr protein kinase) [Streptomyces sp. yr375]|uniref:ATP-binding protein n=1 Tax=Streptomyces sp. yr375 TaxID=1761906 RepID=UPI0008C634D4|nr:ATP-binding protein [Streptomyces sp. yr375]SEQ98646.1 Anti-sigma regulatory factor (Ser/Thr protein kinase) [Streptomyces sp. yr375]
MATVSPSWNYTLHLPRDPRAPGIARGALRLILAAHELPGLAPTVELLAAELLTNSHLHTAGPYALRLMSTQPGGVRVAVWDTDPRVPPGFKGDPLDPAPPADSEHGRGLHLVRECADDVGVSVLRHPGTSKAGKLLWADCGGDGVR